MRPIHPMAFCVAASLAGLAVLEAQSPPATRPALPTMHYADDTRVGRPFSKDPSVIRFRGKFLMYFSLPPFASPAPGRPAGWSIGIAQSDDLLSWKKIAEVHPEQPYETKGLCAPGARVIDGKVHLFYQTYGGGASDAICHATSDDGIAFSRDPSNPVFRPAGAWTNGRAIDAEVVEFKGKFFLYCATRDPAGEVQMLAGAVADAKDGFGRNAWKQLGDAPLLKPELPWEQKCIEAPSVVVRGDTLVMFYAGAYNNAPQQIGVATSTDGISWKRLSDLPFLPTGQKGTWNESESGHPGIYVDPTDDKSSFLFFQGNNDKGRTWFISRARIGWDGAKPLLQPE